MNPPHGLAPVSACDLLMSEGPKLHPQSVRVLRFSERVSRGEAYNLVMSSQNDYLTFFLSAVTFPCASALSHQYPEPLIFG